MKPLKLYSLLLTLLLVLSCEQEVLVPQAPEPEEPPTGTSGSANFTKFVSIGNSLTAGFMAGALFDFGQQNSYPAIMAEHFAYVSENDPFDQPMTGSVNGCYNPTGGCTLGRLVLFDPDGPGGPATPAPAPAGTPGLPAPYNTTSTDHLLALAPYTGNKANLNNFGVPGIILAQALTPATGGPPTSNPAYNPYYARFASNPSTDGVNGSTILGDAIAAAPTFFSFWLGNNDVLGYATSGGLPSGVGVQMTDPTAFAGQYNAAITALLGSNPNLKGVVANIPRVTDIPFFTTIKWNSIVLDAATASQLNTNLGTNYNSFLDAMVSASVITAEERDKRRLNWSAGSNGILITDETLTDLSTYMTGPAAALLPYAQARLTTNADRVCLTAGGYLGRNVDITGDAVPDGVNGVSIPLVNTTSSGTRALKGDDLILIAEELSAIASRIEAFNASIAAVVAANSTRLALADVNAVFASLASVPGQLVDGIFINASFAPPSGVFSEDGVHPNPRGAAYLAKIFIQAINAKFGSTVPLPNISRYYGTYYPVSP
ncbi:MAG: outer membrane protein [Cyclobacteriaceae bacterium]|nr:MAG: outer membrane protein [Cyclobacteriaceae bacterium]